MRIFVTGATGFIGTAIVDELHRRGHDVLGLARSAETAGKLRAIGAEAHLGSLDDLDLLRSAASACDGVIHTAFGLDFSRYQELAEQDALVVSAMARALGTSKKPLVATSVTTLLAPGKAGEEADEADPGNQAGVRAATERVIVSAAREGVRAMAVRLPPSVHGKEDKGFVPALIDLARRSNVSAFVGEGRNRWAAVHRLDAARLFCDALERGTAGARYHAAGDSGIAVEDIARTIGEITAVPTRSLTPTEAGPHFGWLSMFVTIDNPISSEGTQAELGWAPREPGLLEDLRSGAYAPLLEAA